MSRQYINKPCQRGERLCLCDECLRFRKWEPDPLLSHVEPRPLSKWHEVHGSWERVEAYLGRLYGQPFGVEGSRKVNRQAGLYGLFPRAEKIGGVHPWRLGHIARNAHL